MVEKPVNCGMDLYYGSSFTVAAVLLPDRVITSRFVACKVATNGDAISDGFSLRGEVTVSFVVKVTVISP